MSITEVARVAKVSNGTVSNVINGRPGVSPALVRKVRKAMDEIGYVPPPVHKRTGPKQNRQVYQSGRTGNIAIVFVGMTQSLVKVPFHAKLLHGIESLASDHDLAAIFAETKSPESLPSIISKDRVDGVILAGKTLRGKAANVFDALPCVSVLGDIGPGFELACDHIQPANDLIGVMAAKYLINRGHQHLAVINPSTSHVAFRDRERAFNDIAEMSGQGVRLYDFTNAHRDDELLMCGGQESHVSQAVERLLDEPVMPTGIFVTSDYHLIVAHNCLKRAGVEPGRDVELIGCNNEEDILASLDPRPATIDINAEEIGNRALAMLLERIEEGPFTRRLFVNLSVGPTLVPAGDGVRECWSEK